MSLLGSCFTDIVVKKLINLNPSHCADPAKVICSGNTLPAFQIPQGYTRLEYSFGRFKSYLLKKDGSAAKTCVYLIHGGAFIAGLSSMYYKMGLTLIDTIGCDVYYIDYRLAPQYVYPCALEDTRAGWEHLCSLGYEPGQTALLGDSAGGNLLLSLMLSLRDNGKPMPACGVCFSAWADMTAEGDSYISNYPRDPMFGDPTAVYSDALKQKLLQSNIYCYAQGSDRKDPYLSPVYGAYHGFSPMYFVNSADEILLSDSLTICAKLRACGVEVQHDVCPGMFHAFPIFYFLPESKEYMHRACTFIERWISLGKNKV